MLSKKEVLKTLQSLPDKFDAEEASERIVLLEKIRIRISLNQSKEGKVHTKDEVKEILKKRLVIN